MHVGGGLQVGEEVQAMVTMMQEFVMVVTVIPDVPLVPSPPHIHVLAVLYKEGESLCPHCIQTDLGICHVQ